MNNKIPLMIRAPNWVGEVVLASPAFEALSKIGFDLHIFIHPPNLELLSGTSYNLYPLHRNTKASQGRQVLKSLPYKHIVLFTRNHSNIYMSLLARKKSIAYFKKRPKDFFISKKIKTNDQLHFLLQYWELARFTAKYLMPDAIWPEVPKKINLPIRQDYIEKAKKLLLEKNINQPFWVLCPMAEGKCLKGIRNAFKIWPYWKEFSLILKENGIQFVVCPGPGEEVECRELTPDAAILPDLNLGEYLAVMSLAKQIVSNDTGPMHMAATLDVPMLGIFGRSEETRWYPWGGRVIVVEKGWPNLTQVLDACGVNDA